MKMFRTWYIFNKPAMKKKQVWAGTLPVARIQCMYSDWIVVPLCTCTYIHADCIILDFVDAVMS